MQKYKAVTFSLDQDSIDLLDVICKLNREKNKSWIIRDMIKREVERFRDYDEQNVQKYNTWEEQVKKAMCNIFGNEVNKQMIFKKREKIKLTPKEQYNNSILSEAMCEITYDEYNKEWQEVEEKRRKDIDDMKKKILAERNELERNFELKKLL